MAGGGGGVEHHPEPAWARPKPEAAMHIRNAGPQMWPPCRTPRRGPAAQGLGATRRERLWVGFRVWGSVVRICGSMIVVGALILQNI